MNLKYYIDLFLNGFCYFHRLRHSFGYPMIFQIETTNACAMNCRMCPRKDMKRKIGFMDIDLFKKIVDQLKGYTRELFLHHFGDPLLHSKLFEMIDYADEKGIKTKLSTNPVSMRPEINDKILKSKLDYLHISLDGTDEKTYKFLRGNNADYKKGIKYIEDFLLKKNRLKQEKPYVVLAIIRMKETEKEIKQFKDYWGKKLGVNKIEIKQFRTWDGSNKEINKMADESYLSNRYKNPTKYACFQPWLWVTVLWDGRVVPCCYDYEGKYVLGDLKRQSLKEIWNGKRMKELRRQNMTNDFKNNPLCANCREKGGAKKSRLYPLNLVLNKRFRSDFFDYFRTLVK